LTLSYSSMIVIGTIVGTIVFSILLYYSCSIESSSKRERRGKLQFLPYLIIVLTLSLPVISIQGRSTFWFLVQWSVVGLLLFSAFFRMQIRFIQVIIVLIGVATSLSVILSMGTPASSMDQLAWGHGPSLRILKDGFIHLRECYYSFLPIYPILTATLSLTSGFGIDLSFTTLRVSHLAISLALLAILSYKVTEDKMSCLFPMLIILTQPRLDFPFYPLSLSMFYGIMSLFFLSKHLQRNPQNKITFLFFLFTLLVSNVAHAGGGYMIFWIVTLFASLQFTTELVHTFTDRQGEETNIYWKIAAIVFVIVTSYWFLINPTRDLIGNIRSVLRNLLSPTSPGTAVVPAREPLISRSSMGSISSIIWSIPAALSASYVLVGLFKSELRTGETRMIAYTCGAAGCLTVLLSYYMSGAGRSIGMERYLNSPSYVLFLLPSSLVLTQLYRSNQLSRFLSTGLLCILLVVGSTSLNWAPDIEMNYTERVFQFVKEQDRKINGRLNKFIPENNCSVGGPFACKTGLIGKHNQQFTTYIYTYRATTLEALFEYAHPEYDNLYVLPPSMIEGSLEDERIDLVYQSYRRMVLYIKNE